MTALLFYGNLAACVGLAAFVLIYLGRPWWRTPYGRSIMAMKLSVLAVGLGGMVRRCGHYDLADVALAVGWSVLACVVAWRVWMLWRDGRRPNDSD